MQIAYAIGVAEPVSLFVNTFGSAKISASDAEISRIIGSIFDLRPNAIERRLGLRKPIYRETASYGHVGRTPRKVRKTFIHSGKAIEREVELFTWEKLDKVDDIKRKFKKYL